MPKKREREEVEVEVEVDATAQDETVIEDPRASRWAKHLKVYRINNPVKYDAKKQRGEFENIPTSFK